MTTFWARMLIFTAWEDGEISDECARYFDELLESNEYDLNHNIINFNSEKWCILRKIGFNEMLNEFEVLKYIKKVKFEKDGEKVYLASIIKEDYHFLNDEIVKYINSKNTKTDDLMSIYDYLIDNFSILPKNTDIINKLFCKALQIEGKIDYINNKKENKSYKKPAYTDLIDADY